MKKRNSIFSKRIKRGTAWLLALAMLLTGINSDGLQNVFAGNAVAVEGNTFNISFPVSAAGANDNLSGLTGLDLTVTYGGTQTSATATIAGGTATITGVPVYIDDETQNTPDAYYSITVPDKTADGEYSFSFSGESQVLTSGVTVTKNTADPENPTWSGTASTLIVDQKDSEPEVPALSRMKKLTDYTFDIKASIQASGSNADISKLESIENVTVVCYDPVENKEYERIETSIEFVNGVGIIRDVPVYIVRTTDSLLIDPNNTATYETPAKFYKVEIPSYAGQGDYEDLFKVAFNGGLHSAYVTLSLDPNNLVWSASTTNIVVTPRTTTSYDITVAFRDENLVTTYPSSDNFYRDMAVSYRLNGGYRRYVYASKKKNNGDGTFTLTFDKVISDADVTEVTLRIPEKYRGDEENPNHIDSCYWIEIDDNGDEIEHYLTDQETFVDIEDIEQVVYVQNTSMTGIIHWLDSGSSDAKRLDIDSLKEKIKVICVDSKGNHSEYEDAAIEITEGGSGREDEWDILISNLPVSDANGHAYSYYYVVEPDETYSSISYLHAKDYDAEASTYGVYKIRYDNGSNSVSTTLAYDGATIYLSLMSNTDIDPGSGSGIIHVWRKYAQLKWQDDIYNAARDDEMEAGVELYLWR